MTRLLCLAIIGFGCVLLILAVAEMTSEESADYSFAITAYAGVADCSDSLPKILVASGIKVISPSF
jgi:hypothetical protein